jgi:hypothetical protein
MTFNTDIQKTEKEIAVLQKKLELLEKTEKEIAVLQKKLELLKEIETHKSQPKMEFDYGGKFEVVSYNNENYYRLDFAGMNHNWYKKKTDNGVILVKITDGETHRLLEGLWFNEVRKGKYDEVECDEKDNPPYRITDEVVNRLIKQQQAQKLYNRLYDELSYDFDSCNDIVDLVESWIPEPQSASGSQNVDTELLVEGFNDAIRKMKEMLR